MTDRVVTFGICVECYNAESHFFSVTLSDVKLCGVRLNIIRLNVIRLNVIRLNVVAPSSILRKLFKPTYRFL